MCKRGSSRKKNLQSYRRPIFKISLEEGQYINVFPCGHRWIWRQTSKKIIFTIITFLFLCRWFHYLSFMRWMQTFLNAITILILFTILHSHWTSLSQCDDEEKICLWSATSILFIFMYVRILYGKDVIFSLEWNVKHRDLSINFLRIDFFTCF